MAAVEFQKDMGGFFNGKGHWYSVRRILNSYVVVLVQLDPFTLAQVPVAMISTHSSPRSGVDRCA